VDASTAGAKFWLGVFTELRNRGLRDPLIVCCDGLTALPEAITRIRPEAMVQTCVVHLLRTSLRYVASDQKKKLAAALRPIYTAPSVTAAEAAFAEFRTLYETKSPA